MKIKKILAPGAAVLFLSFITACALFEGYTHSNPFDSNYSGSSSSSSLSTNTNLIITTNDVIFDSQGATTPASPSLIAVIFPATTVGALPAAPLKTGYFFAGWYIAPEGGGSQFTASTTVTANITVYAYWTTNTVCTVTYNSEGGSAVGSQIVVSNSSAGSLPANPAFTGYIFGGWFTATNGGGTQFTSSTIITSNITIYALWNSYNYTVTYNDHGTTWGTTQVQSPATTVAVLATPPANPGYTFNGWFTAPNGGGTQFTTGTVITGNITVYSYWIVNTYTITAGVTNDGGTLTSTIAPSGNINVTNGQTQTFTITPHAGEGLTNVIIDGSGHGSITTYSFNDITANHSIIAVCTNCQYTLTVTYGDSNADNFQPPFDYLGNGTYYYGQDATITVEDFNDEWDYWTLYVNGVQIGNDDDCIMFYDLGPATANMTVEFDF